MVSTVCGHYKRIYDSKPATVRNAAATLAEAKQEGINSMAKFFKRQLSLAGLSDSLRDKVLEAKKDTFSQSLELARELESIRMDHKPQAPLEKATLGAGKLQNMRNHFLDIYG